MRSFSGVPVRRSLPSVPTIVFCGGGQHRGAGSRATAGRKAGERKAREHEVAKGEAEGALHKFSPLSRVGGGTS